MLHLHKSQCLVTSNQCNSLDIYLFCGVFFLFCFMFYFLKLSSTWFYEIKHIGNENATFCNAIVDLVLYTQCCIALLQGMDQDAFEKKFNTMELGFLHSQQRFCQEVLKVKAGQSAVVSNGRVRLSFTKKSWVAFEAWSSLNMNFDALYIHSRVTSHVSNHITKKHGLRWIWIRSIFALDHEQICLCLHFFRSWCT